MEINFVSRYINFCARDEVVVRRRERDTTCIWRSLERKRGGGSGSSWRLENGVRYEVYDEMLRVSQLGPDARSPVPLFTSRCVASHDKRIGRFVYIYIYYFIIDRVR